MVWFWGYHSIIFIIIIIHFFPLFQHCFPGLISIRIHTLWAELPLQLSTDHFETIHTCSICSEDVHVVLGLFCHYFFQLFPLFLLSCFRYAMMMWVVAPLTVLHHIFRNFPGIFIMVLRSTCRLDIILMFCCCCFFVLLFFFFFFFFFFLSFLVPFPTHNP